MNFEFLKKTKNFFCDNQCFTKDIAEGIHVSPLVKNGPLITTFDGAKTVYELFQHTVECQPENRFLGSHVSSKAPYEWMTYEEVHDKVKRCGSGLLFFPEVKPASDSCVGIFSSNRPEWLITELACFAYGLTVVPLYGTLGFDAMKRICNETELSVVVCDNMERAKKLLDAHKDLPHLKHIVVISPKGELKCPGDQPCGDVELMSFSTLLSIGSGILQAPSPRGNDAVIIICYTSGTTGTPKGAMIRNSNMLSVLRGTKACQKGLIDKDDTFFSFLPLAHIYEQFCEMYALTVGASIGYYSGSIATLFEDLQTLQPTVFVTVPRLLCRFHHVAQEKVSRSPLKQQIFNWALQEKCKFVDKQIYKFNCFSDTVVFSKMRRHFGGRVRVVLCGGAPIPPPVLRFTRAIFSCPVLEGYGSTETCGLLAMSVGGDLKGGHVGVPLPGAEIKLADVPEMNLVASRDCKGEICVRGGTCITGYYKNPEMTAELVDNDGWLHTGDIGIWLDGSLKVVDRCKHIFKLAQGEYVSPERVEQVYQQSAFVSQVFVDGDSAHAYPVALVVPSFEALQAAIMTEKRNSFGRTIEELCQDPEAKKLMMSEFKRLGDQADLMGFEKVQNIKLIPEPFSIENLLLTPTMKTARPAVRKAYANELIGLYKGGPTAH